MASTAVARSAGQSTACGGSDGRTAVLLGDGGGDRRTPDLPVAPITTEKRLRSAGANRVDRRSIMHLRPRGRTGRCAAILTAGGRRPTRAPTPEPAQDTERRSLRRGRARPREEESVQMKRTGAVLASVAAAALALTACGSKPSDSGSSASGSSGSSGSGTFKACMVLDTGGVDDHSFNQSSYAG